MPCAVLSRVQLCDPMDCSQPGSSVHEIFPGKKPAVGIFPSWGSNLRLLHWQADSISPGHLGSPSGMMEMFWLTEVAVAGEFTGVETSQAKKNQKTCQALRLKHVHFMTSLSNRIKPVKFKKKRGFPGGPAVKNPPANAEDVGLIPPLGRSRLSRSS